MKRIASLCLCLLILFSISSISFAEEPKYTLTQEFIDFFEEQGLRYSYFGEGSASKSEIIALMIRFKDDNIDQLNFLITVDGKTNRVIILCPDYMEYNPSNFEKVLRTINSLHYYPIGFFCDEEKNTINATYNTYILPGTVERVAENIILDLINFVQESYNDFSIFR